MPNDSQAWWMSWPDGRRRAARVATPRGDDCAMCWGQRMIWEPGPLGLLPVVCAGCEGAGHVPRGTT